MTPIIQTTQMLIILMLTLIFNIYKHRVDEWTSRRVDKLLDRKTKGKDRIDRVREDRVRERQSNKVNIIGLREDRVTEEQKQIGHYNLLLP